MLKTVLIAAFITLPAISLAHETPDIISMTAEGFEPKEVEIHQGETIIFQNNDDKDRWPASNFHPTHSLYSEFDPKGPVKPGTSWPFKFEKEGVWRMHDHLFPHLTGTITVLASAEEEPAISKTSRLKTFVSGLANSITEFFANLAQALNKLFQKKPAALFTPQAMAAFKELPEKEKYKFLEDVAKTEDPKIAWAYVKETYSTPQGIVGNPHDLAHLVGQLIFDKHEFQGLSICEPIFAFGCYHGLMEKAFDKNGLEKLSEAEQGCRATTGNMFVASCIHGIGHGLATFESHDLNKALADCEKISFEVYCYDGVFMEFNISAPPSFYNSKSPLSPCTEVGPKYRGACARSAPQVMLRRLNMQLPEIVTTCLSVDDPDISLHCINAVGFYIAHNSKGESEYIVRGCALVRDLQANFWCNTAAAGELIFQNYSGWQTSAPQVCATLRTEDYKNACNQRLEETKEHYRKS